MFLCLLVVLVLVNASSETFLLKVTPEPRLQGNQPTDLTLVARPTTPGTTEIRVPLSLAQAVTTKLAVGGDWVITCVGKGVWCPSLKIEVNAEQNALNLPVFLASTLSAGLRAPRGEEVPKKLQLAGRVRSGVDAVQFEYEVGVESGRIAVTLPAADVDLRLVAEGFVPFYRWDLHLLKGNHDLGPLDLQRGGSVSGFAIDPDSGRGVVGVKALLRVPAGSPSGEELERLRLAEHQVQTGESGFFQIGGVRPGSYELLLEAPDRPTTTLESISVERDGETRLEEVRLSSFVTLEAVLDPPQDPQGRAWKVQLGPAEGLTDKDGRVRFSRLTPGRHALFVYDHGGSRLVWHEEDVLNDRQILVSVPVIAVEGTVRLGKTPLAARIRLLTGRADEAEFTSDADGRFRGWLRSPSRRFLIAQVEAENPPIAREFDVPDPVIEEGVLRLDLRLSDLSMSGAVVTETGKPVPEIDVKAASFSSNEFLRTRTDTQGRFEFRAIEKSRYQVSVDAREATAETIEVDATVGDSLPELRLVIRPGRKLNGLVLSAEGQPVQRAEVTVQVPGRVSSGRRLRTDVAGRFRETVAADARHAVLTVMAPSQVLWSGCLPLPESEVLSIRLPPSPGGTLELRTLGDPEAPPARTGRLLVLTQDGGALDPNDLLSWRLALGRELANRREGPGQIVEVLPSVAAGGYAATWSTAPPWEIAAQLCALGAPRELKWEIVPPGGIGQLSYDVRPNQKRN